MHVVAQGPVQIAEGAKMTLLFVAVGIVALWKVLLRLILAMIAVAIVVAVGIGVLTMLHM